MASEIINAILSRFYGVRRMILSLRRGKRAAAVSAVRVIWCYGKLLGYFFYYFRLEI